MATKKKTKRASVKRVRRPARWEPSDVAPGTVTVTVSLVHIQRMVESLGRILDQPRNLVAFRDILNQAVEESLQRNKSKGKKKPRSKPDSSLN